MGAFGGKKRKKKRIRALQARSNINHCNATSVLTYLTFMNTVPQNCRIQNLFKYIWIIHQDRLYGATTNSQQIVND